MNSKTGPKPAISGVETKPTGAGDEGLRQTTIHRAFLVLLQSVARIAISVGLDCRQVIELTKRAFTDVAFADFGLRQRDTNVARVAVITGLTRKEARRLRDSRDSDEFFDTLPQRVCERILTHWRTDTAYSSSDGVPLPLRFEDETPSFKDLCANHAGDITPGAIRKELLRLGRLRIDENGALHYLESDEQNKAQRDLELIRQFCLAAAATAHNVSQEDGKEWPMVKATTFRVNKRDISRLRALSANQFAKTEKSIQDVYDALETILSNSDGDMHCGVVMFHYETKPLLS